MASGTIATPLGPLGLQWGPLGFQKIFFEDTALVANEKTPPFATEDQRLWVEALKAFLEQRGPWPRLPYTAPEATSLQHQVWRTLTTIPTGQVRTYGEIAAMIGYGHAVRAVAQACAANPCAIIVPCHRVIPRTGGIGGYRWGSPRKQALLALEGVSL